MRTILKRSISVILTISLLFVFNSFSNADVQYVDKIRIGLYFSDSANGMSPVTCFTVSAVNGLQLGFSNATEFNFLCEELTGNPITIKKDTYYTNNGGTIKEYSPTDSAIPAGDRTGPFHVQIGANYTDYPTLFQQLQIFKQAGINAYPVYTDLWQIWTGFYTDADTAQADITNTIQPKLGEGSYTVIQPNPNRIVAASVSGDIMLIYGSDVNPFQVHPKQENNPYVFKINNKSCYRGDLEIRRITGSDMTVINILPLEQYLYGVVPSEIEPSSSPEALKAQAVAARTYAYGRIGYHSKYFFDLCPTTACQVYKGFTNESQTTNKAVDDTAGKKIIYNGSLAQVFYFSSSGGITEDVKNVWGSEIPYLKSVDDSYESGKSWHYTWQNSYTADKIKQIMQGRGKDIGDILSFQITKVSEAGRATEVIVSGTKGKLVYTNGNCKSVLSFDSQWYTVKSDADVYILSGGGEKIKTQLGAKNVMTADGLKPLQANGNNIKVVNADGVISSTPIIPTVYTFEGKGWGHSVGMSQEGAKGMAKAGFTYEQILQHYFTGVTIQ